MNRRLAEISTRLTTLDAAFRERALRERMLIAAMIVGAVFLMVDAFAIRPLDAERARLDARRAAAEQATTALNAELERLARSDLSPEAEQLVLERSQLLRQLETIADRLRARIEGLVPPEAVVTVLEDLLRSEPGLRLVRLETHPPERLGADGAGASGTGTAAQLYRHGLTLEIEGGFAGALAYLEQIERSPWRLLWDRFELRVGDFPNATVTIELHTIGETEEWIGV